MKKWMFCEALLIFVCWGLMWLLNTWGHFATVPTCSSMADLSCYPLMWNVILEYTTTNFNVLSQAWPGNHSPTFLTPSEYSTLWCLYGGWLSVGSSVENVPYPSSLEPGTCSVWIQYGTRSPTAVSQRPF